MDFSFILDIIVAALGGTSHSDNGNDDTDWYRTPFNSDAVNCNAFTCDAFNSNGNWRETSHM